MSQMVFYINLLFIVIAVSLDGFGVGVTYGMRKIRIPFKALLVIMLCSGIIVLISMMIGHLLRTIISPTVASMIGSTILIFIGIFVLFSIVRPGQRKNYEQILNSKMEVDETANQLQHFKSVLKDPFQADKDKSGTISVSEAFILGTALALDAFGAGLGAAMLGYSPFITAVLIATMSGLFVFSGIKIGFLLSQNRVIARLTFMPPLLLIGIGLFNLI